MTENPQIDAWLDEGLDRELVPFVTGISEGYARYPAFDTLSPREQRMVVEAVRSRWNKGGPVMHKSFDRMVGQMGVRLHAAKPGIAPALIYLHGGGWTFMSLDSHDRLMREYAARAGITVIGIEYPLAPEVQFPNQLTLLADLVETLATRGEEWKIDPARLIIGGDSAGANLALATALALREKGRPDALKGLLLNYGAFDASQSSESQNTYGDGRYLLSKSELGMLWNNYLREKNFRKDPFASPILADLTGLPSTWMTISDLDVLRDENIKLATRFIEARVPLSARLYPGSIHSFLEAASISSLADLALQDSSAWLAHKLGVKIKPATL